MMLRKWEKLPPCMQTDEVRAYYDALRKRRCSLFFKRVFDVFASLVLLILLSPACLVLAIAIKIDSHGPVFYRQVRVTQYGKQVRIFKFRSMVQDADRVGTAVTVKGDARVTRVGAFIRKYRFDEFSQLIDVLRGKMTLVGTRPEVQKYVDRYTPEMMATLLLPAGITSLTSIYYRDEAERLEAGGNPDEVYVHDVLPEKMYYNLKAVREYSFWQDIKILFMTFFAICGKEYKGDYQPQDEQDTAAVS